MGFICCTRFILEVIELEIILIVKKNGRVLFCSSKRCLCFRELFKTRTFVLQKDFVLSKHFLWFQNRLTGSKILIFLRNEEKKPGNIRYYFFLSVLVIESFILFLFCRSENRTSCFWWHRWFIRFLKWSQSKLYYPPSWRTNLRNNLLWCFFFSSPHQFLRVIGFGSCYLSHYFLDASHF